VSVIAKLTPLSSGGDPSPKAAFCL